MALSRLDARPRNGTRHGWRIPAAKPTVTARDGARSQMASIDEDTSYEEKRKKGHQKRGCAQGNECPPCQVSCHVHGCYVTQHRDISPLQNRILAHECEGPHGSWYTSDEGQLLAIN